MVTWKWHLQDLAQAEPVDPGKLHEKVAPTLMLPTTAIPARFLHLTLMTILKGSPTTN